MDELKKLLDFSTLKFNHGITSSHRIYGDTMCFMQLKQSADTTVEEVQIIFPDVVSPSQTPFPSYYKLLLDKKSDHPNLPRISLFHCTSLNVADLKEIEDIIPDPFKHTVQMLQRSATLFEVTSLCTIIIKTEPTRISVETWIIRHTNNSAKLGRSTPNSQPLMSLLQSQVDIIQSVVAGLTHLHEALNMVHGSICPENVAFSLNEELPVKLVYEQKNEYFQGEELLWNVGEKTGDLFALGIFMQQVLQLKRIPFLYEIDLESRKMKLQYYPVEEHSLISNAKQLIQGLTPILCEKTAEDQTITRINDVRLEIRSLDNVGQQFGLGEENQVALKMAKLVQDKDNGREWYKGLKQIEKLGQGGYGSVYKMYDSRLKRFSAVKRCNLKQPAILKSSVGSDKGDHEDINPILEFQNMQACFHKNLVKLYQYHEFSVMRNGTQLKQPVIEMELCGPNLRTWLDDGDREAKIRGRNLHLFQLQIAQEITAAVCYLHSQGIIHRDLNPANIFFSLMPGEESADLYQFPMKVGDFGLSKLLRGLEMQKMMSLPEEKYCRPSNSLQLNLTGKRGTPTYRAPEVSSGVYGKQADIFSLGFILLETFQDLRDEENRLDVFERLKEKGEVDLVQNHGLVKNAKDLILSMTKKDPASRTQSILSVTFNCGSEPIKVSNSDELRTLLQSQRGCNIFLTQGEYQGPFEIDLGNTTITGETSDEGENLVTIVMPSIFEESHDYLCFILVSYCHLKNLKFSRAKNHPSLNEASCIIKLKGNYNNLENIEISGGVDGIRVEGGQANILGSVTINSSRNVGLFMRGSGNTAISVTANNCGIGFLLSGSSHYLSNIVVSKEPLDTRPKIGLKIFRGQEITINNLMVDEAFTNEDRGLVFGTNTDNITVKDSVCGPLFVGGKDHRLTNVRSVGHQVFQLDGGGHVLENCKAIQLQACDEYELCNIRDSVFESISYVTKNEEDYSQSIFN